MNFFDKVLYLLFFIALMFLFFKIFLALLLVILLLCFFRTWQMKREPNQSVFAAGALPNPKPDGFYQGSVGFKTSWLGKKFFAENSTGVNVIAVKAKKKSANTESASEVDKYPFKTYTGPGLFDQKLFVQKIDYNVKGNPFWIKWILDEIVQIGPDHYLGKMQLRIIPGLPFSVLYFELKKQL